MCVHFEAHRVRMSHFVASFITSLLVALLLVRSASRHGRLSADHDLSGPQKFHSRPVPRVGGIAIFIAMIIASLIAHFSQSTPTLTLWLLIAASLPTFVFGLAEDLTKSVSPRRRLFFTAVSVAAAVWLLDAVIRRTAIPGIDYLLSISALAVALTILVVTGVANAINIIDGFNGLASMCVLIMVLALAYVAFQVGDTLILTAALSGRTDFSRRRGRLSAGLHAGRIESAAAQSKPRCFADVFTAAVFVPNL
jgi:UDP-N-acetylmuramyl pentapeptide phosphotransferase/UDP-N-acetylglucosamine-1-phosphate transferase